MHPTMDFPKCLELSEIVRQYVLAWMIANQDPRKPAPVKKQVAVKERSYSEITASSLGIDVEFGETDAKALGKRVKTERSAVRVHNRAKAKQEALAIEKANERKVADPRSIIQRNPPPSPKTLAALAEQAKLALAEARELAGEPVIYCCAAIRKEGIHECWAECESKTSYRVCRDLL